MTLEEYKNKQTENWMDQYQPVIDNEVAWQVVDECYKKGFDAALALNLPVKFAEWKDKFVATEKAKLTLLDDSADKKAQYIHLLSRIKDIEGLYKYWVENVLKLEDEANT